MNKNIISIGKVIPIKLNKTFCSLKSEVEKIRFIIIIDFFSYMEDNGYDGRIDHIYYNFRKIVLNN